ncbi:MAG: hypothetical protein RDU20_11525 [Desulfomonilaceae bacterium]|nr:hypothetical protein [Desulfomonilaceae bacterium]
MTDRFTTRNRAKGRRLFAMLFIPVVVLHLAWITPLVEWSCFCPEDQPNYGCCCNCPKCVKNRGGFRSFCHLRPKHIEETENAEGASLIDLISGQGSAWLFNTSQSPAQISVCECDSHIKKISLDTKPFVPQAQMSCASPFPVVGIIPTDDWRSPEAIPCQPDPPG